jgi:hypothetical protein
MMHKTPRLRSPIGASVACTVLLLLSSTWPASATPAAATFRFEAVSFAWFAQDPAGQTYYELDGFRSITPSGEERTWAASMVMPCHPGCDWSMRPHWHRIPDQDLTVSTVLLSARLINPGPRGVDSGTWSGVQAFPPSGGALPFCGIPTGPDQREEGTGVEVQAARVTTGSAAVAGHHMTVGLVSTAALPVIGLGVVTGVRDTGLAPIVTGC